MFWWDCRMEERKKKRRKTEGAKANMFETMPPDLLASWSSVPNL